MTAMCAGDILRVTSRFPAQSGSRTGGTLDAVTAPP
jgi:hypothetical protein